jgi:hypothetical protein
MNPRKLPYLVLTTRPEGDDPLALAPTTDIVGTGNPATTMNAALADALMRPNKASGSTGS